MAVRGVALGWPAVSVEPAGLDGVDVGGGRATKLACAKVGPPKHTGGQPTAPRSLGDPLLAAAIDLHVRASLARLREAAS